MIELVPSISRDKKNNVFQYIYEFSPNEPFLKRGWSFFRVTSIQTYLLNLSTTETPFVS